MATYTLICAICKTEFTTTAKNAKYCCRKCKDKAANMCKGAKTLQVYKDRIMSLENDYSYLKKEHIRLQKLHSNLKLYLTMNEKGWF